jgi:hypothetical protein
MRGEEELEHVLVNGVVGRLDDEDTLPFDLFVESELGFTVGEHLELCGEEGKG